MNQLMQSISDIQHQHTTLLSKLNNDITDMSLTKLQQIRRQIHLLLTV